MLEVISAAVGFGIYGALRGFSDVKYYPKPLRLITGHALVCCLCLAELRRRSVVDLEREHLWINTHRTSRFFNDAIDTGSPKYLLSNLPVMVAAFSGSLATVASFAFIFRRT